MRPSHPLRAASCIVATMLGLALAQAAVPVGYRYVGSRLVSEGRVVFWYWNVDYVEIAPDGAAFVARMYARALDVDRERPYVATIRCDQRLYREHGARGAFETIDDGEPIDAVWRAGCRDGRAVALAERNARLAGHTLAVAPPAEAAPAPPLPAPAAAAAPAVAAAGSPAQGAAPAPALARDDVKDPRRADPCIRFAEAKSAPAGDATITNTCAYPIEVTLCYKGGGNGAFDCATPARGKRADSLGPGVTHVLPEYRRGHHKGIAAIACKGTLGTVFPRLDDSGGKSGCF